MHLAPARNKNTALHSAEDEIFAVFKESSITKVFTSRGRPSFDLKDRDP